MNVFVAKRNIVDYIYKSANLEGISVTYPETQQIYDGGNVARLKVDEIVAINNLKHAWQFILDEPPLPDNYAVLCEINRIIGSNLIPLAGTIRSVPVKMGGTSWIPQLPIESQIKEELDIHLQIENQTDRAITIMLWGMRRQMFLDGNKRTSMLFANKIMIDNGCGIIEIPIEKQAEFYTKLIKFYETNEMEELKTWIYDECIDGIDMDNRTLQKSKNIREQIIQAEKKKEKSSKINIRKKDEIDLSK